MEEMTELEILVDHLLHKALTEDLIDVKFGFAGDVSLPLEQRARAAYEMLTDPNTVFVAQMD